MIRRPILTLSALWGFATPVAAQAPSIRVTLVDTAVLKARRLDESSGVAASRRRGVYWTHNDSGDGPYIYATDTLGNDLGALRIAGAGARDWEDMSRAPCSAPRGMCLYLGDIGDNGAGRSHIEVYVVAEPDPPESAADTTRRLTPIDSIRLRYPDHAHNAEALAVTSDGRLFIVTKDMTGPARLFTTTLAGHGYEAVTLTPVCDLNLRVSTPRGRQATGAAISPDGRWLVVRTYVSLHFFALDGHCTPLLGENGVPIPVVETQGEAVAFEDDDHLVLTSERGMSGHAILTRLAIQGLPKP